MNKCSEHKDEEKRGDVGLFSNQYTSIQITDHLLTSNNVHDATVCALNRACRSRCQKKIAMMGNEIIDVSNDTISPGKRNPVFKTVLSLTTARGMYMMVVDRGPSVYT